MTPTGRGRRRLIHLATGLAAPWLRIIPAPWGLLGLAAAFALAVGVDVVRLAPGPRRALATLLPGVYRADEAGRPSGATLLAAGYLAAALVAPPAAAAGGIAALAAGDPAAAWVGGRYAASRTRVGKTWVGSAACFVAALPAVWVATGGTVAAAAAAGALAALLERGSGRFDNLVVPPGVAALLALWTPAV